MKLLITGSNGMLGSDLLQILEDKHEIIATNTSNLDITNNERVIEELKFHNPDMVINAAAYTDVDGCENKKDLAYAVNALGPNNLAIACNRIKSKLVHISTDYVFNGESKIPYMENDKTNPINSYGETKLKGEEFIQNNMDDYFIIRTSWLYGFNGNNFVKTMLELSKNHEEISVVNDQKGSPTYTHDLAIAISKLIETDFYGIYNITNTGVCSWFDFAKDIFEIADVKINLNPVTTDEFPRPAKRPKYSVLSNQKWKNKKFNPLRHYKEALSEYISLI